MYRFFLALFIACCLCSGAFAQDDGEISKHIQDQAAEQRVGAALESARHLYHQNQYGKALNVLQDMREMPEVGQLRNLRMRLPFGVACLHSVLGEQQQAIESLQEAIAGGLTNYVWYGDEPDLDPIRLQPAFRSLMSEVRRRNGIKPLSWDRRQMRELAVSSESTSVPDLARIVPELHLDNLGAAANADYNKLLSVAQWVGGQWKACDESVTGNNTPMPELGSTCGEYASVMAGAAQASGMRARIVVLMPKDVEQRPDSHAVAEVWLESFHKWVLVDGQYGIVPAVNGVPLNAVELQDALASGEDVSCGMDALACVRWSDWVLQYLYYFEYGQTHGANHGKSPLILRPMGAAQPYRHAGAKEIVEQAVYVSNPDLFYVPETNTRH